MVLYSQRERPLVSLSPSLATLTSGLYLTRALPASMPVFVCMDPPYFIALTPLCLYMCRDPAHRLARGRLSSAPDSRLT